MGNCLRRRLPADHAAAGAQATALLDAVLSLRRLPARQRPGSAPPSSHEAALSALRYRYGCRWHYLHALKVKASQAGPMLPEVSFAFLTLRCLAKQHHKAGMCLLNYLKHARGE